MPPPADRGSGKIGPHSAFLKGHARLLEHQRAFPAIEGDRALDLIAPGDGGLSHHGSILKPSRHGTVQLTLASLLAQITLTHSTELSKAFIGIFTEHGAPRTKGCSQTGWAVPAQLVTGVSVSSVCAEASSPARGPAPHAVVAGNGCRVQCCRQAELCV